MLINYATVFTHSRVRGCTLHRSITIRSNNDVFNYGDIYIYYIQMNKYIVHEPDKAVE